MRLLIRFQWTTGTPIGQLTKTARMASTASTTASEDRSLEGREGQTDRSRGWPILRSFGGRETPKSFDATLLNVDILLGAAVQQRK